MVGGGGGGIDALVQQGGMHGRRRAVLEPFLKQMCQHCAAPMSRPPFRDPDWFLLAVERGVMHTKHIAGGPDFDIGSESFDGRPQRRELPRTAVS
jgi:hypothetical protein